MRVEHHPRRARAPFAAAIWTLSVIVVLAGGVVSPLFAQESQDYIVIFRPGSAPAARAAVVRNAGAAIAFNYRGAAATAVRVPGANALSLLRNDPSVTAVIPDRRVSAYQNGNGKGKPGGGGGEPAEVVPAGVARVGAPGSTSNGSGIGVAILDTGIDLAHRDLGGTIDAFSAFGGSCQDDEGHGTHVAGIVAARRNDLDVVGVAPDARLYCVKVLDAHGSGTDSTVMAGLDWVLTTVQNAGEAEPPIRVVNLSLGRPGSVDDNPALQEVIQALKSAGVAVVAAAGNDPAMEVSQQIPAAYPEVISVASTTARSGSNGCRFLGSAIAADTASYFTTDGAGITVSAPGEEQEDVTKGCFVKSVGILSTRLGGGTTRMSGTSMAAPHVAGVVARYYQQYAGYYTVDQIRSYLEMDVALAGAAPRDSPVSSYTFDGIREGIAKAP